MKKIVLVGILLMGSRIGKSQSFAEWFEQNKTRLKYYEEQVSALQVYIGVAEKGYKIAEDGLHLIGQIKHGEFNTHDAFYSSMETINPRVAGMAEVAEIVALQIAIIEKFSQSMASYRQNKYLSGDEMTYIGQVYSNVLNAGLTDVNALLDILTAEKLKMTDADRIARIRMLDQQMRDQYEFTSSFTGRTDLLAVQRRTEKSDIENIKNWYRLP